MINYLLTIQAKFYSKSCVTLANWVVKLPAVISPASSPTRNEKQFFDVSREGRWPLRYLVTFWYALRSICSRSIPDPTNQLLVLFRPIFFCSSWSGSTVCHVTFRVAYWVWLCAKWVWLLRSFRPVRSFSSEQTTNNLVSWKIWHVWSNWVNYQVTIIDADVTLTLVSVDHVELPVLFRQTIYVNL